MTPVTEKFGRNQTAWSDQAKNLAQQSLNGALRGFPGRGHELCTNQALSLDR